MSFCKIIRRKFVTIGKLSLYSGTPMSVAGQEWREEACGAPLFGNHSETRNVCDSCLDGWTHEHNTMLETVENRHLIQRDRLNLAVQQEIAGEISIDELVKVMDQTENAVISEMLAESIPDMPKYKRKVKAFKKELLGKIAEMDRNGPR